MKSKIIIFKKRNTKQSSDTGDFYLKTEAGNNREICHTENHNKDILITESQDKIRSQDSFSFKKLNTLNINNQNPNSNYLSTEVNNVVTASKRKDNSVKEISSPVSLDNNMKNTPQKQSSFKTYINQVNLT